MFRVRAGYALMLGVLLAAVAQAQQPMPGMMPGGMLQQGPMMQGPMMLPPVGGPIGPAMGAPMLQGPSMVAPASYQQQQLWYLHELDSDQQPYNIPLAYELQGRVELDALDQSFQWVVNRQV